MNPRFNHIAGLLGVKLYFASSIDESGNQTILYALAYTNEQAVSAHSVPITPFFTTPNELHEYVRKNYFEIIDKYNELVG